MHTFYLFPGLGVNEGLFKNLDIGYRTKAIHWIPVNKNEDLKSYALRLAEQIDITTPYSLLGVSFGGMCVIEIAKELAPKYTILISSAKGSNELPIILKIFRAIPIHKLLNDAAFKKLALLFKYLFGVRTKEEALEFKNMLEQAPENYFPRAVNCIVNWGNTKHPINTIHLHGDNDLIIPFWNIKNPIKISEGNHLMVFNRATEINALLKSKIEI